MKPLSFLKSLLPSFTKTDVLDDVRLTRLEITSITQPSYENALRIFNNRKFANADLREDFGTYTRMVKPRGAANIVVAIEQTFKPMLQTLELVETLIEKSYNEEIAGAGITYYKASVLQMLEQVNFVSRYARKYLNYVLVLETAMLQDDDALLVASELKAALIPADVRYLKEKFVDFCSAMATLSKPANAIKSDFEKIPDVVITEENARTLPSTMGAARIDPFNHGAVSSPFNLFYHVGMAYAEWQTDRLKAAKEEKDLLELRIMRMERQIAGKQDATVEKQINYTMGRVENLEAHIRRKEKEYA